MAAQQAAVGGEQEFDHLIQQPFQVQLGLQGGTVDQAFESLPAELVAVVEHFPQAAAQLGIGILHQAAGEVGIGGAENLEVGIHAQGDALQGYQRADDQGVIGGNLEGEAIHNAGEIVGYRFEIHATHSHL